MIIKCERDDCVYPVSKFPIQAAQKNIAFFTPPASPLSSVHTNFNPSIYVTRTLKLHKSMYRMERRSVARVTSRGAVGGAVRNTRYLHISRDSICFVPLHWDEDLFYLQVFRSKTCLE